MIKVLGASVPEGREHSSWMTGRSTQSLLVHPGAAALGPLLACPLSTNCMCTTLANPGRMVTMSAVGETSPGRM
ncbi:MAG: hypothetical protein ABSE77_14925 [Acidimicrobiales bacterium]